MRHIMICSACSNVMGHIMICPACSNVMGRGDAKDGFNVYDMVNVCPHCEEVWYSSEPVKKSCIWRVK